MGAGSPGTAFVHCIPRFLKFVGHERGHMQKKKKSILIQLLIKVSCGPVARWRAGAVGAAGQGVAARPGPTAPSQGQLQPGASGTSMGPGWDGSPRVGPAQ